MKNSEKIFEIPGCEISEKSGIRDERRNSLSRTLKNEYEQDAEANTHRTVKGKLSDRSARTPRKWTSDPFCAESEDIQHISIGHDSGAGLTILLPKAARREAGYAVSG